MQHAALDKPLTPALQRRLLVLWERTDDAALRRLAHGEPPVEGSTMASEQECSDWVGTCLMNAYKNTGDVEVFALLFELNRSAFLRAIKGLLRRSRVAVEADDVLQEVFLNICRYPHHFLADQADAFRNWGHRIVRNTLLRFVASEARQPLSLTIDEDHQEPEDRRARPPDRVVSEHESAAVVNHAYVLFLGLYLHHFQRLAPGERRVLLRAEIEGWCYRDIANELGVQVANIKMRIFRSRRRITRGMAESLAALERMELAVDPAAAGGGDCDMV